MLKLNNMELGLNFPKLCSNVIKCLPQKQNEVISRRFGLKGEERETLESIGESYGITRERVRQIQNDALSRLKPEAKNYQKVFEYFIDKLKAAGDLRQESILLRSLGGQRFQNHVFFLLTLEPSFQRFSETDDYHTLWTINPNSLKFAKKLIDSFYNLLQEKNQPLKLEDLSSNLIFRGTTDSQTLNRLSCQAFTSYVEISKKIQQTPDNLIGLREWPEINPRGVKDKAYIVFKKEKKPLHFTTVAKLIGPSALSQTVHNELIRDPRFVLVGRGLYALREWGYTEGYVKDIILKVLKETKKPLSKEEILERVLKQRLVKEATVLLNLANKEYFLRDSQGRYRLKTETI